MRGPGQLERFLQLVPIEYGRGVDGRSRRLDFEIQEAITFRDGAEAAYADLAPVLLARDAAATRSVQRRPRRARGRAWSEARAAARSPTPTRSRRRPTRRSRSSSSGLPRALERRGQDGRLRRHRGDARPAPGAPRPGDWGGAESARLEAYGIFELGPEQRLRGLAPGLFQEVEGYFWYGPTASDGLVQLIKRKATDAELAETRAALDDALAALGGADRQRPAVERLGRRRTARSSSSARASRRSSSSPR